MAADKAALDPTGTWKVTTFNPQTNRKTGFEETLKLKLESEWSGATVSRNWEAKRVKE